MSKCLIAEYETITEAGVGLQALEAGHFTLENVSVISSVSDPAADHLHHLHVEPADDAPEDRNVGLGMLIGGSIAAPIAAGTMIGPFIVIGPLVGMAIGAAVGSLLHSTERWGVDRDASSDYEQRVRDGSVLIIVNDEDETRLDDAVDILEPTSPKSLERFEVT